MREKKEVLVISFNKTSGALELESLLKDRKNLGRIIPTPSEVSAGCGFSWRADLEAKEELIKIIKENNIEYDKFNYLKMY